MIKLTETEASNIPGFYPHKHWRNSYSKFKLIRLPVPEFPIAYPMSENDSQETGAATFVFIHFIIIFYDLVIID